MAAVALLIGWWLVRRRAIQVGFNSGHVQWLTLHMIWWGFFGSHVLYLILIDRPGLVRNPWRLLNPIDGIYSFGGMICGMLAVVFFARRYQLTRQQVLQYFDIAAFVFPTGWLIARVGCALAHDHVGRASNSWMAVQFPEGPRLDLGLIEAIYTAAIVAIFYLLDRRRWPPPFYFGLFFLLYGPFRLWLDTMRQPPSKADTNFGAGAIMLGCAMLFLAWRNRSKS